MGYKKKNKTEQKRPVQQSLEKTDDRGCVPSRQKK